VYFNARIYIIPPPSK